MARKPKEKKDELKGFTGWMLRKEIPDWEELDAIGRINALHRVNRGLSSAIYLITLVFGILFVIMGVLAAFKGNLSSVLLALSSAMWTFILAQSISMTHKAEDSSRKWFNKYIEIVDWLRDVAEQSKEGGKGGKK